MIGILVELIISGLLLWLISKKTLAVLGFMPTKNRVLNLLIGLLFSGLICSLYQLATTIFANNSWTRNQKFIVQTFWASSWWVFKSVLFEELIFRGALLYIAIRKIGAIKACILSAVCFGIYHWFSYNAFGSLMQMTFIFIITAIAGLMFAFAFAKTISLYLPIGLHFGWNLVNIVMFSNGPLGQQIFIRENQNQPQGILSLVLFLFQIFALPLMVYLYLKKFKPRIVVSPSDSIRSI